jgi:hypothetical protein
VGRKKVFPFFAIPFLRDAEVGAINCHSAVVTHIVGTQPAIKVNLQLRGAVMAGVRGWVWKKKGYFLTAFLCFLTLANIENSAESQGVVTINTTISANPTL